MRNEADAETEDIKKILNAAQILDFELLWIKLRAAT